MNKNYKRKVQQLKHQRYVHRRVIKHHLAKRNKKHPNNPRNNKSAIAKSPVLNCLDRNDFSTKDITQSKLVTIDVPQIFCLSKNPDKSILFLRKLYSYLVNPTVTAIHFNHFTCEYMGVCASTIMDIIIMECIKWRRKLGLTIRVSGNVKDNRISYNEEVDALVKMSGLLNHLHVYRGNNKDVEKLELICNGDSSTVAELSIQYLQRSLSRHGQNLNKLGVNRFSAFLGEIVDNCKLHGGQNAVWYTLGHYSFDKESELGKCKLCIIDFGDTIYESLKNCGKKKILKRIDRYVKKSWFSFRSVRDTETLYTLFSLQQRVSRIIDKNAIRGNGTVTFIESFLDLFNTNNPNYKSVLSITSGRCSILFDGKYKMVKKSFEKGYSNKIIAFNEENDLSIEPDPRYVRTLKNGFPGTVISMDLYFDSKYLKGAH